MTVRASVIPHMTAEQIVAANLGAVRQRIERGCARAGRGDLLGLISFMRRTRVHAIDMVEIPSQRR